MANRFDVLIAGGGPVGWACALAAAHSARAHRRTLSITVLDRTAPRPAPQGMIESRVYTVTEDNLRWLNDCGVELRHARMCDVEAIRVFDQRGESALCVSARDAHRARLATLIEHDALTAAIAARATALGVTHVSASAVNTGELDGARYLELADRSLLSASLVIVAEGANSALRDSLGVARLERDYARFGVVAHFACAEPHRGEARQWFLPDRSILALLPLPDIAQSPAVSMVWSCSESRAQTLLAATPDELCDEVKSATRNAVTPLNAHTKATAFPLRLVRVADPVASRALVVGDAAHAIHPLAGQGVNLGLGDARAFSDALSYASKVEFDCGHPLLLAKFRRSRYSAVLGMQAATDGLARLYNLDDGFFAAAPTTLASVADLGMRVLGRVPAFRRVVSSAAS